MAKYETRLSFESPKFVEKWMLNFRKHGGYDPTTKKFSRLHDVESLVSGDEEEAMAGVQFMLDSIAAANELDLYSQIEELISECFESREDFHAFASSLELYSLFWVNERHFDAFSKLRGEDYGFRTYEEIGETLQELAE